MRSDGIEAVGARRYRNGQAQFQLEPVASQSWWGQAYMVDKISPNWNRTNLSISKTWWGQVPMSLYAPARLFQVEPAGYIVVCLWYSYPNRPTKSSRCSKSIFSTAAESFRLYPSLPFASLYALLTQAPEISRFSSSFLLREERMIRYFSTWKFQLLIFKSI